MNVKKLINKFFTRTPSQNFFAFRDKILTKFKSFSKKTDFFYPFDCNLEFSTKINNTLDTSRKIAVHIHCFYTDLLPELYECLICIPQRFDLFVSTDTDTKKSEIENYFCNVNNLNKLSVTVFQNKGRDIYPFLYMLKDRFSEYDYICHIHTKKSLYSNLNPEFGNNWRRYLYKHLFGSRENVKFIINKFNNNKNIGMIYPPDFPLVHKCKGSTKNERKDIRKVLKHFGIKLNKKDSLLEYSAGSFFWFRTDALKDLFLDFDYLDINCPEENKQRTSTILHSYERIFTHICKKNGYSVLNVFNNSIEYNLPDKKRIIFFAHFDCQNKISKSDLLYLKSLKQVSDYLYFSTTSDLPDEELSKLNSIVNKVLIRKNIGFDFGSWKDSIIDYGLDNLCNFDEVIIVNNSCYYPVFPLINVFSEMKKKECDFWGLTIHPGSDKYVEWLDGPINESIQSYFICFKKQVFTSPQFSAFWKEMSYTKTFEDTIKYGELYLTKYFSAKFKYDSYTCSHLNTDVSNLSEYTALIEPQAVLLMGSPLIKKKVFMNKNNEDNINDLLSILKKLSYNLYY